MQAIIIIGIALLSSSVFLIIYFSWINHKAVSSYKKSGAAFKIGEKYAKAS